MRFWKIMLITFGCMIVIFAFLAVFIAGQFKNINSADETSAETISPEEPDDYNNPVLNFLLVGIDYQPEVLSDYTDHDENGLYRNPRFVTADTLLFIRIDGNNKEVIITSVPSDLIVNSSLCTTLGEKYSTDGVESLITYIRAKTGLVIDYYGIINIDNCKKILDKIGNISYNVPCDMYYSDPCQDLLIDLKKGMQYLSSTQCLDMIRYDSYTEPNLSREILAEEFVKSIISKVTSPTYITKLPGLIKEVYENFETDISLDELLKNIKLINDMGEFEKILYDYPSTPTEVNGKKYSVEASADEIEKYKENIKYRS